MQRGMTALYLALVLISTSFVAFGALAVFRTHRRPRTCVGSLPPVSVLKPLCGVDSALRENLTTFFEQDYPEFELIFGVQGEEDPAAIVVRELRTAYPDVVCRLVVHDGGRGVNPKVSNLRSMMGAVMNDVVVVSDSNVAVHPNYLREMATELAQQSTPGSRVGLVTSLFTGVEEETIGATLENLHLNGTVAGGVALSNEFAGKAAVVGKSMMFRRTVFERLGGFSSVAHVLAEDYVMGRMFDAAGYEVRLAKTPIRNVVKRASIRAFFKRHERWSMMRFRLMPHIYVLEPLSIPLVLALAAPAFGIDGRWPLVWAVGITLLRDSLQWTLFRGPRGLLRALPLFPLRDALILVAWVIAPLRKHVTWRGNRVRVSAGTRLYAEHEPDGPGLVIVEENADA